MIGIKVPLLGEAISDEPLFKLAKKEEDFLQRDEETAELSSFIISSLKHIVHQYDPHATIILFGSRARGDYHEESDWDFLILTSIQESDFLKEKMRKEILYKIEFKTHQYIATILHNKDVWQQDYQVTNLFKSIAEEGIVV